MEKNYLIRPSVCHSASPSISHFYPSWSVTLFPIYPSNTTSMAYLYLSIYGIYIYIYISFSISSLLCLYNYNGLKYHSLPSRTIASNVSLTGRPKLRRFCQSLCGPLNWVSWFPIFLEKTGFNQSIKKNPNLPVTMTLAVFSSRNENFWISHRMFRGCRKGFSDINKKN